MARVKLTEHRAKSLLIDDYVGVSIRSGSSQRDINQLDPGISYVIKVDQGVKKRSKQGLIRLGITREAAADAVRELAEKGFDHFLAEPMVEHTYDEEHYLSVERTRGGMKILYSPNGGVDIEDHPESIKQYTDPDEVPLPDGVVAKMIDVMNQQHLSFVEINPLVAQGETCTLLDAAVLADSAGGWRADWTDDDIAEAKTRTTAESTIYELNQGSPASFSFRVMNPDGAIWLLLSGGGASITIADEAANHGKAHLIGNYGENSGGPTREETQLYTEAVLEQMFESSAQPKALVIAGGVANFTDVRKTFAGIVDALAKHMDVLHDHAVKVYVRRGGPNEKEGLKLMESFLKQHDICGSVAGSDAVLTDVVNQAVEYVDA